MIAPTVTDILPKAYLQEYVNKYQVIRFIFPEGITPPAKYHLPRPEHCITFYIRDIQRFSYTGLPAGNAYPRCTINGIYTIPVYRSGGNDFLAIKVIVKPAVLYRLLKLPLPELTNRFINAEDVWGSEVASTCERLQEQDDLPEMISIIETFIEQQIRKANISLQLFDKIPDYILTENGNASVDRLADQACLSIRQYIRKFEARVGVSTKTLERIIRFDSAYRMKNRHPDDDWLSVAVACNYHDYQHMVRDFKAFSNFTPLSLYKEVEMKAPERFFGFSYLT